MSRKFKHRKLGWTTANFNGNSYCTYNKEVYEGLVNKELIENSTDWEEVIEKDYEILEEVNVADYSKEPFGKHHTEIRKVRCKKTGLIWSVGDKSQYNDKTLTITHFEIAFDKICVRFKEVNGFVHLHELKKPDENIKQKEEINKIAKLIDNVVNDPLHFVIDYAEWVELKNIETDYKILQKQNEELKDKKHDCFKDVAVNACIKTLAKHNNELFKENGSIKIKDSLIKSLNKQNEELKTEIKSWIFTTENKDKEINLLIHDIQKIINSAPIRF